MNGKKQSAGGWSLCLPAALRWRSSLCPAFRAHVHLKHSSPGDGPSTCHRGGYQGSEWADPSEGPQLARSRATFLGANGGWPSCEALCLTTPTSPPQGPQDP